MALAEDVALDQLELEPYNIKVGAITDCEQKSDKTTYTNDRTNTLTLTFDEDNEYYIVPHVKDLSDRTESSVDYGSTEGMIQKEFVIDRTAPVISAEYTTGGSTFSPKSELLPDGQRAYSTQAVTASVTIEEKNFWLEDGTDKSFAADQFTFDGTQGVDSRDASMQLRTILQLLRMLLIQTGVQTDMPEPAATSFSRQMQTIRLLSHTPILQEIRQRMTAHTLQLTSRRQIRRKVLSALIKRAAYGVQYGRRSHLIFSATHHMR